MSRTRGALAAMGAAVWEAAWRPLAAGGVVGVAMLLLRMTFSSAVVVALAVAALAAILLRIDGRPEPRVARTAAQRRDGLRGDVHDLAWTMVGRDGRAGERAMRRLRQAGARRLARHGLDLDDPDQADAVARLVGGRAYATLTHRRHPMPSVRDLTHALGVLERLGATRTRPDATASDDVPTSDDATASDDATTSDDVPTSASAADLPDPHPPTPRDPR